ncbi:hypothetical protein JXO52_04115 [bacterium]|nr:hypothetical protein [bacterium]
MTTGLNRTAAAGCLFLLLAAAALGQTGVQVTSAVDRSRITIGDLITYTVTVSHPDTVEIEMPGPAANLGGFEIRDYRIEDPRRIRGGVVSEAVYTISTFVTGEFAIPPLTLHYRSEGDTLVKSMSTQEIPIVVESMKASEAGDIRDIKPPEEIPRDWRRIMILGAAGLLALLLIAAGIVYYRRRKAGAPLLPVKTAPPRPPHEIAREALDRLRQQDLPAQGKIKEYYIELSDIIRRYIEGRFYLVALEMTTTDVLEQLAAVNVSQEDHALFREFLQACDLVKFARYIPSNEAHVRRMDQAYELVDRTRILSVTADVSDAGEEVTA